MPAVRNQREIDALVRVGQVIASTADYEQALAQVIVAISELLDVETGGFLLYEADRDELVLQQPGFGVWDARLIGEYHVPLSAGGNAVNVFLSRVPYVSNHPRDDPRVISRFAELFGADTVLTVPLVVEDEAIGVFHAMNKRGGEFTAADVDLLSLVAPFLATSIRSVRMFRELREQRRQLERAISLQAELSRTAVEAPGMGPLAERLAHLLSRPVMVLDPDLVALARARWPADRPPTREWLGGVDTAAAAGPRARPLAPLPHVTPIAVGDHAGGYLAVLEAGDPLDTIDVRAVEHAATIFALEMLREQTAYEVESRVKGDALSGLFAGGYRDEAEAAELLRRLGYTVAGSYRVARFEVAAPEGPDGARGTRPGSRVYQAVNEACRDAVGVAAVAPWRNGFVVLVPSGAAGDAQVAQGLLDRLRATPDVARPGCRLHLGMGRAVASPAGFSLALEEAGRALRVARSLGVDHRPVLFDHLGVYRVLLGSNDRRERADFVSETLGAVIAYDADHGGDLAGTLRALAAADYNVAETARRLFIHTNTLKYRLKRIETLLGGDPSRGDLRLEVELALKILDLPRLASPGWGGTDV